MKKVREEDLLKRIQKIENIGVDSKDSEESLEQEIHVAWFWRHFTDDEQSQALKIIMAIKRFEREPIVDDTARRDAREKEISELADEYSTLKTVADKRIAEEPPEMRPLFETRFRRAHYLRSLHSSQQTRDQSYELTELNAWLFPVDSDWPGSKYRPLSVKVEPFYLRKDHPEDQE